MVLQHIPETALETKGCRRPVVNLARDNVAFSSANSYHTFLHNGANCRDDRALLLLMIILNLFFHERQDKRLLPDISVNSFISAFKT